MDDNQKDAVQEGFKKVVGPVIRFHSCSLFDGMRRLEVAWTYRGRAFTLGMGMSCEMGKAPDLDQLRQKGEAAGTEALRRIRHEPRAMTVRYMR